MQEQKEEQLRLQREEEEKRLADEARLIRLEEERVKMVEKVRQERERVMQQN